MAQRSWDSVLGHIRSLAARSDNPACDAELLRRFVAHRDETAFEALLRRHGPMVLRVARRILGNETDAEDVFQATFLLLARRAGSIRKRESVASWLHGVAHRLALSARGKRARRQQRERDAAAARAVESPPESSWSELEETLHEVLAQLPAKYRTPLVYCYLEGRTQEEVARQLGKPLGTVRSWLARGRELLRKRLLRRGILLSTEGASTALSASACATAEAVPPSLRMATFQAANVFVQGGNVMTKISPAVAALVRQGMTAIVAAKIKSGAVWVLALALLAAGSGWAAHRTFIAKTPEANETAKNGAPPQAAAQKQPRTDAFGDPLPPEAVARMGTIRFRHESQVTQFALSPDGRTLAAVGDKSVAFWDLATGQSLHRLTFKRMVHCLAFTPDGKSLAVGAQDCIIRLIDSTLGKVVQQFAGHQLRNAHPYPSAVGIFLGPMGNGILTLAFSDGQTLISWGSDGTMRVWDTRSGKELRQIDVRKWDGGEPSPDVKLWAVRNERPMGRAETKLHLLDAATGKEIRQLNHSHEVLNVAFSPDRKTLAVGLHSGLARITLWDLESGKELGTLVGHKNQLSALAFSPDGKLLVSAGHDKMIHFWDLATQKERGEALRLPTLAYQLEFSPDGKTLISVGGENRVRLWDVATGRERFAAHVPSSTIAPIVYSPDGKRMACASDNRIWLWESDSGKLLQTLGAGEQDLSPLSFSADGQSLISVDYGGAERTLRFFNLTTGKEQKSFGLGKGRVALSPDGKIFAVSGEGKEPKERKIQLLDAGIGAKLRTIEAPAQTVTTSFMRWLGFFDAAPSSLYDSLDFSPDGKTLYGWNGNRNTILRWDVATGKALPSIGKHEGGLSEIAISPDGRSVASTSGGNVYLWESATGQKRFVSKDAGFADRIAFSPDGRLLAVVNTGLNASIKGKELIWEGMETRDQVRIVRVADGKVIHRFTGHLGGICSLSFAPDGRTLASGGFDSTVLVWDMTKLRKDAVKETPSSLRRLER